MTDVCFFVLDVGVDVNQLGIYAYTCLVIRKSGAVFLHFGAVEVNDKIVGCAVAFGCVLCICSLKFLHYYYHCVEGFLYLIPVIHRISFFDWVDYFDYGGVDVVAGVGGFCYIGKSFEDDKYS